MVKLNSKVHQTQGKKKEIFLFLLEQHIGETTNKYLIQVHYLVTNLSETNNVTQKSTFIKEAS